MGEKIMKIHCSPTVILIQEMKKLFINEINSKKFTGRRWRQPTPEELSQLSSLITDGFSLTKRGWFLTVYHLANGSNRKMYLVFFGGKAENLDYVAVVENPYKK